MFSNTFVDRSVDFPIIYDKPSPYNAVPASAEVLIKRKLWTNNSPVGAHLCHWLKAMSLCLFPLRWGHTVVHSQLQRCFDLLLYKHPSFITIYPYESLSITFIDPRQHVTSQLLRDGAAEARIEPRRWQFISPGLISLNFFEFYIVINYPRLYFFSVIFCAV